MLAAANLVLHSQAHSWPDKTDNEGELKLQEDSDDDANDCSNALHNYFSDNDDLEESFLGFSSSDDSGHS